ncbi:MDR family MFS transporter [Pseudoalteromonas phenolica]|uniref:MDR family MFS transporter n=1 Tax=Pseudoalteromonas phenolica TaxID=161398 RepID=UPI00110A4DEE|nr:MFS transporter [Pseudoalteromonas phenolica]TMO57747.1 MFS transporter [Pseudoalteromonas phenolica]
MSSELSFSRVKDFPLLMWILLFGSFITRGSFFMVWPFLAVILYDKFALSATEVGLILSTAAVVAVFVSFIGSTLSDKLGRQTVMYATGVLYIVSFSLLAEADTVTMFAIVITLCSIATALWRPLASALIGDIIDDSKTRELAMQSMYFIVNVGCAVGPIAGVWLGLTGQQSSFYITTVAFAFLLGLLVWGFSDHKRSHHKKSQHNIESPSTSSAELENNESVKESIGMKQTLAILAKDRLLQCLILANVICLFIYGQMDSSLVQYLTRENVPKLLELVSSLIFTNAIVIITCQFLLLRIMAKVELVHRIQIGLVLLMCSQAFMAINAPSFFWGWIGAVVVLSLAEAILFPTMNVHIDRIAPDNLRGAYFGASAFYDFGFAFAPLGGGIILDLFGGFWLFVACSAMCVLVMGLYYVLEKLPRPDFTEPTKSEVHS